MLSPSSAHWLQIFRDFYGPTHKAFAALDAARQAMLERDIVALLERLISRASLRWLCLASTWKWCSSRDEA
jgi:hypothetical protein